MEWSVFMSKGIIISGMRPTGSLHLGNYFGALENWVKLQNDYDCSFFVADWHALTTGYEDTESMKKNIFDMVVDWLSAGLDPNKCNIFLQSQILQHAELHTLLSMMTPLSWLLRCPTYKAQIENMKEKDITTYGFLGYPCLMSSDILLYRAGFVPVGEDQLPHLELTREIARRFNFMYGDVFPEPKPLLTKSKSLVGLDGRKMSKSYNNYIGLTEAPEEISKKVMQMTTDPKRIRKDDPGDPEVCSVYAMHKIFNEGEVSEIEQQCKGGCIGCVACKRNLAAKMQEALAPIYERKMQIIQKPEVIREIIEEGNKKCAVKAEETMQQVRQAMKIDF